MNCAMPASPLVCTRAWMFPQVGVLPDALVWKQGMRNVQVAFQLGDIARGGKEGSGAVHLLCSGDRQPSTDNVLVLSSLPPCSSHIASSGITFYGSTIPHQFPSHLLYRLTSLEKWCFHTWVLETPGFVSLNTFYPASVAEKPGRLTLQSAGSRSWVGICKLRNELRSSLEKELQKLGS